MPKQWEPGDPLPGSAESLPGKCGALMKRSIERYGEARRCTRPAGWGTNHQGLGQCKLHGGSTPAHVQSAATEMVRREMTSLSERLGVPTPIGDPADELLKLASQMTAFKDVLLEKVQEISDWEVSDVQSVPRMRALVSAFQEAMRDVQSVLVAIEKLGLARRRIELDEQLAEVVASAVFAVIFHPTLELSDDKIEFARSFLAEKLAEIGPKSVIDAEVVA